MNRIKYLIYIPLFIIGFVLASLYDLFAERTLDDQWHDTNIYSQLNHGQGALYVRDN